MSKDTEALQWLAKNAQWNEKLGRITYKTVKGKIMILKQYAYENSPPRTYVPGHGMVSLAKAVYFMTTGIEPEIAVFKGPHLFSNIVVMTRAEQASAAAGGARKERLLPPNVYGTSDGMFIGRKGKNKTAKCESAAEAANLVAKEAWS